MKKNCFTAVVSLLCASALFAADGPQGTRWRIAPDGNPAIEWIVREGDAHRDHLEMSGLRVSVVVRYGVDADGGFRLNRNVVWPMLRTVPNNTHASLMRRFAWDVPAMIEADGEELRGERVRRIRFDGTLTVESDWESAGGQPLSLTRVLFPSVDAPVYCEKYVLRNGGSAPVLVEIPAARSVIRTRADKGVEGSYELVSEIRGDTTLTLAPQ